MHLYTPDNLHYPIRITKIKHRSGDEVDRNSILFDYEYKSRVVESSRDDREGKEVERTWPSRFECELEGTLAELHVREDQMLTRRTLVAEIEEACTHEVQFGGMCAVCGKDLTNEGSYNSTMRATDRATVNTDHKHTQLKVSREEAGRTDEEAKRRLLESRKLSLVVDLDQTIIQACCDPTIAEWQADPDNPNYEALKDVQSFQLSDDSPGARGQWYHLKQRPGLDSFLRNLSKLYEMHIYTMGTRTYAEAIAKIIDPDRKIFGSRILSRDENGSMTAKNLKRLFPVDTRMVVIIDDRGDVWGWSPNLVKVPAFDFFVGTGDINGSFLPKRPEMDSKAAKISNGDRSANESNPSSESGSAASSPGSAASTTPSTAPSANGDNSTVAQIVSMAGNQDEESIKEKTEEQSSAIEAQLNERPLAQKQKILEETGSEAKASPAVDATAELLADDSESNESKKSFATDDSTPRPGILYDDDYELVDLEQNLERVHKAFYEEWEKGRTPEPAGANKKIPLSDLDVIPDVAALMNTMKSRALGGTYLVFSGVVPLGMDLFRHDTVRWAQSFGATIEMSISKRTTHIIASPERRTAKVRQAAKRGGKIKIVSVHWLTSCFKYWDYIPETAFFIHSDAMPNGAQVDGGLADIRSDHPGILSESDEEAAVTDHEADTDVVPETVKPNGLRIDTLNDEHEESEVDTELEELEKYKPSVQREDSSPIEGENPESWDDINDELAEFLGSEAEDTENEKESVKSSKSDLSLQLKTPNSERKRKREKESDNESTAGESSDEGSRLQKRKKEALGRTTSLNTSMAAEDEGGEKPNEGAVAVDPGGSDGANGENHAIEEDAGDGTDDDADLEAALAAEMEKEDGDE